MSDSDDSPVPTPNPTAGAGANNPALQLALQQAMGPGGAAGQQSQQQPQPQAPAADNAGAASSNNGGFDLQAQIQQMMAMQQQQTNANANANATTPGGQQGQEQGPTIGTPGAAASMNGAAAGMQTPPQAQAQAQLMPGQNPFNNNNTSQLAGLNPAMLNQLTGGNPQQMQQLQQMQAMQNNPQMQQLMQQQALLNNQIALMGGFGLGGAAAGMNMNGLMGAQQLPINMQMQAMQMGLAGAVPGGVNPNQLAAIAGLPGMAGFNVMGGGMGTANPAAAAAAVGVGITSSSGADAVEGSAGQSSKEPAFPVKLHRILSNPEFRDVIAWLPHGRSWKVIKPKSFEESVIPLYFRHAKYASFMRQVNGWGFKRMRQGPDHNSYYHELFLRGTPQEVLKMRRPPKAKPGSAALPSPEPAAEPDFYAMSKLNPLPDIDGSVAPPMPTVDTSALEKPKKSRKKSKKKKKSKSSSKKGPRDNGDAIDANGDADTGSNEGQRKADLVKQLKEVIGDGEDDDGAVGGGGGAGGMPAPATVGVPAQQSLAGLLGGANGVASAGQGAAQPGMPQQAPVAEAPSVPVQAPAPQMPSQGETDNGNAQDNKSVSSDGKRDVVAV